MKLQGDLGRQNVVTQMYNNPMFGKSTKHSNDYEREIISLKNMAHIEAQSPSK